MKTEDIIKAVAELDGRYADGVTTNGECYESVPQRGSPDDGIEVFRYLNSLDVIVPVIRNQTCAVQRLMNELLKDVTDWNFTYLATPAQLCEALLRATGKWKD